ncbi:MAG: hypothetical protein AAF628_08385 [Planctomycetota bacterium]
MNEQATQPQPGSAEHQQAMAAAADAGGVQIAAGEAPAGSPSQQQPAPAQRPENVPEKFWDPETGQVRVGDLADAYAKLEQTRGQKPADPNAQQQADPAQQQQQAPAPTQEQAVAAAEKEYAETGVLSAERRAELNAAGYTDTQIDGYLRSTQTLVPLAQTVAGGEDKLDAALKWAANGLTPTEQTDYQAAIDSGEAVKVAQAVQTLMGKFNAGSSNEPSLVGQQQTTPPATEGFRSSGEMVAAMGDPRYKTDANYRAEVQRKIAAADKAGVSLLG